MKKRVLIVAAHPDDEILGCGGTIARFVKEGYEAYTLILGEGVTARDKKRGRKAPSEAIINLKKEARRANSIIGVKEVIMNDLPDNRFDAVQLLDIVKMIESAKRKIKPAIMFTHYRNDLNVDHRLTYEAVITATRPVSGESVKRIYSFETLSSTEYNYPVTFSPDTFFDITKTIKFKLKAFAEYKSEICKYPHPRSAEGIKVSAKNWGIRCGLYFAEAFETVRCIED